MQNLSAKLGAAAITGAITLSPIHAIAQTSDPSHPITNTITDGTCHIQVHRTHPEAAHWYSYDMSPELYVFRKLALSDVTLYQLIDSYKRQTRQTPQSKEVHDKILEHLRAHHGFEQQDYASAIHIILNNFDYILLGISPKSIIKNELVAINPEAAREAVKGNEVQKWFTDTKPIDLAPLTSQTSSASYNALRQQAGADHNTFLSTLRNESRAAFQACAENKNYPEKAGNGQGMGENTPGGNNNENPPAGNGDNNQNPQDNSGNGNQSNPDKNMDNTQPNGGLSVGAIIGIVVGVIAAVAGLVALAFPAIKPILDRILPR
ncbi:MAG: hypothetical protein Q4A31_07165 [Corynebacterium sp.]|uniref:hypothetical protein n=1 Tax=Corynebacterium sp. TaxID=1720 RepID=UPI0026DC8180|nr:hypothetical protein [Corynebacterium sp.]MDO4761680.1 hypothetical protein [Corynebacterium sp.]